MLDISHEARDLVKYSTKCAERAAITSDTNNQLGSRRRAEARNETGTSMTRGSDDDMQITASRQNSKAAKSRSLAALNSKRKKKIVTSENDEPQEVLDSDSDSDTPRVQHPIKGNPSGAVVVDSPSPKKKRAPRKKAAPKAFKSSEFILDEVDDDEPMEHVLEVEEDGEDENVYEDSFINDGSSEILVESPNDKGGKTSGKGKEKAKGKSRATSASKRKKTFRPHDDGLTSIVDDEQDEFVPDTEDEVEQAPRLKSTRKAKQRQVDLEQEESVVPVYPMDAGYSDGPDDEGEQTEPDIAPDPSTKKPRNARVAAIAHEEGYGSTTHDEEYNSDDLVDLTEEDPFDMGVIDVDLYDDAPSQRFRDFEADYGQVKLEKGTDPHGSGDMAADEFDDMTFDQSFMDNLDDFDFHDHGGNLNDDAEDAAPPAGTTYTRTAAAADDDQVVSEEEDDAERFVPISALSAGDRDFFLNHWRRSAMDATGLQGSEKQLAESRQQAARGAINSHGRGRGGRPYGGGGKWRGGRGGWRGRK
ncbi:hypothetical protein NliqN6_0953 [Naganishia liquefaciens]|uniref:Uncharacterized protein n=1 Tax=Naganishia liquefaciens TaxID=104408 RepID=A0A8H3YE99_9TREE|nr:hypothetical protein NliqN6_0953 [Naganishia liquefaciens]